MIRRSIETAAVLFADGKSVLLSFRLLRSDLHPVIIVVAAIPKL
jgi:hypothetical protein